MEETKVVEYNASDTISEFHFSDKFVRGVMGPIGSGKSVGMCCEIMRRACEQQPSPDGIRKSRWAIIRNTYPELKSTTIKTWLDWFPEEVYGAVRWDSPITHNIRVGDVELEVMFLALDKAKDVKRLLSLELTGAFINEAREVPKTVIDAATGRVGRYPSKREGGASWFGVIMDTNPPDDDHWWFQVFEVERPHNWELFKQPSGLSAGAENIDNLPPGYYQNLMTGKTEEWIKVYARGEYGTIMDGKPVYPEFSSTIHLAKDDLPPIPDSTIYIGIDFGLTPAALFAQKDILGRWRWIDELVCFDMGAYQFGNLLLPKINSEYADFDIEVYGDPAGGQRSQSNSDDTPFKILQAQGINILPAAKNNDYTLRREAVAIPMQRLIDGVPGLLVSPKCKYAVKGFLGGYRFKRIQVANEERYQDKPDKTEYSHVHEAGQYAHLGGGEGNKIVTNTNKKNFSMGMPAHMPKRTA